jgi:hypothetical protein
LGEKERLVLMIERRAAVGAAMMMYIGLEAG